MGMRKGYKQTDEHKQKKALSCRRGAYFKCKNCENTFWRQPSAIKAGNTTACSRACYYKQKKGKPIIFTSPRVHMIGERNHNWKGGITPESKKIRTSLKYKNWARMVKERDNFACTLCGARNGNGKSIILHTDHIKPFALYPELRFDPDNGRTLCISCHRGTDTYGWNKMYATKRLNADKNGSPMFSDINGN